MVMEPSLLYLGAGWLRKAGEYYEVSIRNESLLSFSVELDCLKENLSVLSDMVMEPSLLYLGAGWLRKAGEYYEVSIHRCDYRMRPILMCCILVQGGLEKLVNTMRYRFIDVTTE
ncbi:hypothetical protein QE152_g37396 [Popillia japonica]|uniref:Uncharacterized protein n=1 Tax=Popillia japonica TaxID=7064 RepID=A0AAW1IAK9_POPJA